MQKFSGKISGNFPQRKNICSLFLCLTVLYLLVYFEYIEHLISSDDDDGYGVNVCFKKNVNLMLLKVLFVAFLSYQTSK